MGSDVYSFITANVMVNLA